MLALGAAMVLLGAAGIRWTRLASLLLVGLSVLWLYLDVRPEGPVLWKVSHGHGLVLADLWGLLGVLVGAALIVRGPGRRRDRR
ncbi:MAG TPA: hypothetical protein VFJ14_10895 [Nocardioidaceae bacterium]|nr:hypothetical protein [Nocardioidaceae bacterium]